MDKYSIIQITSQATPPDPLRGHLKSVPQDEAMISLVTDLYERYQKAGKASQFIIRPMDRGGKVQCGLLVGRTAQFAIFWRRWGGHFWIRQTNITFQHPAAFLRGTRAPIIDRYPEIGASYLLTLGCTLIVATRICSDEQIHDYLALVDVDPKIPSQSKPRKKDDEDGAPMSAAFDPIEGLNLLGP